MYGYGKDKLKLVTDRQEIAISLGIADTTLKEERPLKHCIGMSTYPYLRK